MLQSFSFSAGHKSCPFSHLYFSFAPPHLSVKYVRVVVDVVGQQVGLGAHQQHVPRGVGPQLACRQTGDGLVDVEQGDV